MSAADSLRAAVVGLNFLSVIGVSMPSRWGSIVAISVVFSVIYGIAFFRLEDSRKNRRDTLLHLEASQGRERELEQLRATAEIRALQALMEPHFVFNTLNSIAALIHDQPDRAEATTLGLARLTRQILDIRLGALATLATEIALVRDYLEIEQTRMGGRLRYEISVPDGLLTHPVPPLLLQPMVENAVKHGVRQRLEDGCVWLVAREVEDALEIQIIDNGPGFSTAKGTGSGMSLVQDRLERIYGDAAEVRLERDEGAAQTVATLKIPTSAAPPGSSAPRAFPGRAGARPDPHLGAT